LQVLWCTCKQLWEVLHRKARPSLRKLTIECVRMDRSAPPSLSPCSRPPPQSSFLQYPPSPFQSGMECFKAWPHRRTTGPANGENVLLRHPDRLDFLCLRYLFLRLLPDDQPGARTPHATHRRSRQRGGGRHGLADVQHSARVPNRLSVELCCRNCLRWWTSATPWSATRYARMCMRGASCTARCTCLCSTAPASCCCSSARRGTRAAVPHLDSFLLHGCCKTRCMAAWVRLTAPSQRRGRPPGRASAHRSGT